MQPEFVWSVLLEAELRSSEEYDGEADDRLLMAFDELGYAEHVVTGGGPIGQVAARTNVEAESWRVAMDRASAVFEEAVRKSGLEVGSIDGLEAIRVDLLPALAS